MKGMTSKYRSAGFSIFELVIVVGIAGILAAIGTSSFKYVTTANRISAETNGLLGDLQFARSEAQKEGQYITLCPANLTGTACASPGTTNWSVGWIVFVDLNDNHAYDAATEGTILRWQKAISPDVLQGGAATLKYVTFNREGFADSGATTSWGTLILNSTPVNPNYKRCIAISAVGAIKSEIGGASVPTTC